MRKAVCGIWVLVVVVGLGALPARAAEEAKDKPPVKDDTPTRSAAGRRYAASSWLGAGQLLYDKQKLYEQTGLFLIGRHVQAYQLNLSEGSVWTHRHSGRWQGRYDIDVAWNAGKVLGWKGASFHATLSGRWSNGLNATSVGAFTDVSAFGSYVDGGDEVVFVSQYFYDQNLFDRKLLVRLGKFSLGNFDRNMFAEDPSRQFMNASLSSNPTIPVPEAGLGAMVHWRPTALCYLMAAVVDADADQRETGFNTAFHGKANSFTIAEAGYEPLFVANQLLPGSYRVGFWYDPQPKPSFHDGIFTREGTRDDMGFYLNFSQMLWRENPEGIDMQGLGVFGRYGYRHSNVTFARWFWSAGCQYQGLIPGRGVDTLGFGVAQIMLEKSTGLSEPTETAYELYYNAPILPFLNVGASVQYVRNPGGWHRINNAVVLSFRASITF